MRSKASKKLIAVLMTVIMLPTVMFPTVGAVEPMNNVYSDIGTAVAGTEVEIPIYISENSGFAGFGILATYDPEVLTPISVIDANGIVSGTTQNSIGGNVVGLPENTVKTMYSGTSDITADGLLFTLVFEVNSEAIGTTIIEIAYDSNDTINENIEDVAFNCEDVELVISNAALDNLPKIVLDATNSAIGESITVSGTLFDKGELSEILVELQYDATAFQFASIHSNATVAVNSSSAGALVFSLRDLDELTENTSCFEITMNVKNTATAGNYTFIANATSVSGADDVYFRATHAVVYGNTDQTTTIGGDGISVGYYNEYVDVPVMIGNNAGLMGYKLTFTYDEAVLEPTEVVNTLLFAGNTFYDNVGARTNSFDVMWNHTTEVNNNGVLFYIRFIVLTGETIDTSVTVTYSQADTFDEQYEDVVVECKDIEIVLNTDTITNFEYRLDGENIILTKYTGNNISVTISNQYTVGSKEYTVSEIAEDAFVQSDTLTEVYFSGTYDEWAQIDIGTGNDALLNTTLHISQSVDNETIDFALSPRAIVPQSSLTIVKMVDPMYENTVTNNATIYSFIVTQNGSEIPLESNIAVSLPNPNNITKPWRVGVFEIADTVVKKDVTFADGNYDLVMSGWNTVVVLEQYLNGDMDGNNKLLTSDVRQILFDIVDDSEPTATRVAIADFNGDGIVDTCDAWLLLRHIVGDLG